MLIGVRAPSLEIEIEIEIEVNSSSERPQTANCTKGGGGRHRSRQRAEARPPSPSPATCANKSVSSTPPSQQHPSLPPNRHASARSRSLRPSARGGLEGPLGSLVTAAAVGMRLGRGVVTLRQVRPAETSAGKTLPSGGVLGGSICLQVAGGSGLFALRD
jgi:hypothetical protein